MQTWTIRIQIQANNRFEASINYTRIINAPTVLGVAHAIDSALDVIHHEPAPEEPMA